MGAVLVAVAFCYFPHHGILWLETRLKQFSKATLQTETVNVLKPTKNGQLQTRKYFSWINRNNQLKVNFMYVDITSILETAKTVWTTYIYIQLFLMTFEKCQQPRCSRLQDRRKAATRQRFHGWRAPCPSRPAKEESVFLRCVCDLIVSESTGRATGPGATSQT